MQTDLNYGENELINALRRVREAKATKIDSDIEYTRSLEALIKAIKSDKEIEGVLLINDKTQ